MEEDCKQKINGMFSNYKKSPFEIVEKCLNAKAINLEEAFILLKELSKSNNTELYIPYTKPYPITYDNDTICVYHNDNQSIPQKDCFGNSIVYATCSAKSISDLINSIIQ